MLLVTFRVSYPMSTYVIKTEVMPSLTAHLETSHGIVVASAYVFVDDADDVAHVLFGCGFEAYDDCGIEHVMEDTFSWTRFNDSTPSFQTGPHQAFTGQWYLYLESSAPRVAGDVAR